MMWWLGLAPWVLGPALFATETVNNAKNPRGKPVTVILEEDLRIAPEGREDVYLWSGPGIAVDTDARGHMFITDDSENRIIELDAAGAFVRQIGGPGQAPGEFQGLRSFQLLADGSARAFQNLGGSSAVSYYDRELQFLERKLISGLGRSLRFVVFAPGGDWLGTLATKIDPQRGVEITEFLIMDRDYRVAESLLYWETPSLNPQKVGDPNHWAEFLSHRFGVFSKGYNAYVAFSPDGAIYTAKSKPYEVVKWNRRMEKQLVMTRDYEPIIQTEEEVEAIVAPTREGILSQLPEQLQSIITPSLVQRAVNMADFPPVKFPIGGLSTMEDGHLLVIHDTSFHTGESRADIFDEKGRYLGFFRHPRQGLPRMVFKNGYAYTIESDDDENMLVRYKVRMATL